MKQTIGEQQIHPQLLQKVAPDVVSTEGQQKLQSKQLAAQRLQGVLDKALQIASTRLGGDASTRIKDTDTAMKKVGQKRLEGRADYSIDDLRDLLGGRLVVDKDKIPQAKEEIGHMQKAGLFTIKKEEQRNVGDYQAYHYDVKMPDGTMAELQIHTKKSEASSIANHDIRANFGDKPPKEWQQIQEKQAAMIDNMSGEKAKALTQALQSLHKMSDNKPIPAVLTAAVIKGVSNNGRSITNNKTR